MSELRMNSEDLHNLGEGIKENATTLNSLITTFTSQYQSLTATGTWDGPDSVAFASVAESFAGDLTKTVGTLEEVGQNLVNTSDSYDGAQDGVKAGISAMMN